MLTATPPFAVRFAPTFSENADIAILRRECCWQLADDRFVQNQAAHFEQLRYGTEARFLE